MDKPKHKYEELLMEAIGFTKEDLEANRAGHFSHNQHEKLKRSSDWYRNAILLIIAIACISLFTDNFPPLIVKLIGVSVFLGWCGWEWIKLRGDLCDGSVKRIEGSVWLDVWHMRGGIKPRLQHILKIQGKTFYISKRKFLAFRKGDSYTIYFVPQTMTILSAEWLR